MKRLSRLTKQLKEEERERKRGEKIDENNYCLNNQIPCNFPHSFYYIILIT